MKSTPSQLRYRFNAGKKDARTLIQAEGLWPALALTVKQSFHTNMDPQARAYLAGFHVGITLLDGRGK